MSAKSINKLYAFQNGKCFYCAVKMDPLQKSDQRKQTKITPTFDHMILKCNGGKRTITNGVCACKRCNQLRGDIAFDVFRLIVTDIPSRQSFIQQRHVMKQSKKSRKLWLETYPKCTLQPGTLASVYNMPVGKSSNNNTHNTHNTTQRKTKRRATEKLINILKLQNGKCCCCNEYTLDHNRKYEDLSSTEYTIHPYRPRMSKGYVQCNTCYKKQRQPKQNGVLMFFVNMLKW